jgi:rhodanese-related sulfurtransferase
MRVLKLSLYVLALAALFVTTIPAMASTPVVGEQFQVVSLREASELHGKPGVYFLDCNEPEIHAQYHVPGSVWVTSDDLRKYLPADHQATVVFYCYNRRCSASHAAAREAVKLGYRKVFVMRDGISGWVLAGLPVEKDAKH